MLVVGGVDQQIGHCLPGARLHAFCCASSCLCNCCRGNAPSDLPRKLWVWALGMGREAEAALAAVEYQLWKWVRHEGVEARTTNLVGGWGFVGEHMEGLAKVAVD